MQKLFALQINERVPGEQELSQPDILVPHILHEPKGQRSGRIETVWDTTGSNWGEVAYDYPLTQAIEEIDQGGLGPVLESVGIGARTHAAEGERRAMHGELTFPSPRQFVERAMAIPELPISFTLGKGKLYTATGFTYGLYGGSITISSDKKYGRHDVLTHAIAWLSLPPEYIHRLQNRAGGVLEQMTFPGYRDTYGNDDANNFMKNIEDTVNVLTLAGALRGKEEACRRIDTLIGGPARTPEQVTSDLRGHLASLDKQLTGKRQLAGIGTVALA